MTIRCCEFHLPTSWCSASSSTTTIASLLEEQIDALARGAKAA